MPKMTKGQKVFEKDEQVSGKPQASAVRIVAGYGGPIPTRFREAAPAEQKKLLRRDPEILFNSLLAQNILTADDLREAVKVAVYRKEYQHLTVLPKLLDRFPQFYSYATDMLKKRSNDLPPDVREELRTEFSKRLLAGQIPEYVCIALVDLLGSEGFCDRESLMRFFRSLSRHAGAYIGRSVLNALIPLVDRNDVIEIRRYFIRADEWERRAIAKMVDEHLVEQEKRPWQRNVKAHAQDDPFLLELVAPVKKKKKRKDRKSERK